MIQMAFKLRIKELPKYRYQKEASFLLRSRSLWNTRLCCEQSQNPVRWAKLSQNLNESAYTSEGHVNYLWFRRFKTGRTSDWSLSPQRIALADTSDMSLPMARLRLYPTLTSVTRDHFWTWLRAIDRWLDRQYPWCVGGYWEQEKWPLWSIWA